MRVILTGSSGFLGGHLAEAFRQHGHTVVGIVRPASHTTSSPPTGIELLSSTLDDVPRLQQAMNKADAVVHVAAKVHTHGFWRDFVAVTIEGTRHVLQAAVAARVPRIIQISTAGVYGFPSSRHPLPFRETDGCGNVHHWNYYTRAKIEAERIVLHAHQSGRISATVIRPTWIYGPRDSTTFDRILTALRDRRMKWIGDGNNRLSLIHVRDAAQAIVLAATASKAAGQIYNVADDEASPTQREFIMRICELMDLPPPTSTIPYPLAYAAGFASEWVAHLTRYRVSPPLTRLSVLLFGGRRRYSSDKIRIELGWQPAVSFESGILQTAQWGRQESAPPRLVPAA